MRLFLLLLSCLVPALLLVCCVDPYEPDVKSTVDVVVVDGVITNLAEVQVIRLNRSRADPFTGRFGTLPIAKATVEVVVDSAEAIACHETIDGSYQLPSDFKGQVGHAYQLRFTLTDGTRYVSNQQVMQAVPPIDRVYSQFNQRSLPIPLSGFYTAGHDIQIDFTDPADQHNYYRWDWKLYEPQVFCRTCVKGYYSVYEPIEVRPPSGFYRSGEKLLEDCFYPPERQGMPTDDFRFDYFCRTKCWEILYSYSLNLFDDQLTNGGLNVKRTVSQIPFYQNSPCLAEIRQGSLTKDAYRYYKLFQDQTQNTGGLADTPPTALIGNVRNVADPDEAVIGFFTASAVSTKRHYIDRRDTEGIPYGSSDLENPPQSSGEQLFYALNLRKPIPEPSPPNTIPLFVDGTQRPPTAICAPSETRTPFKPEGWPD